MKMIAIALLLITATLLGWAAVSHGGSKDGGEQTMAISHSDFLHYPLETIQGDSASLASFRGEVLLVVNVASKCGLTPQYEQLQQIYERYSEQGFTVVGFPANNFLGQEPGSNEEIHTFCTSEYDVSFPMMAKISVKGDDQHPVYSYLTHASPFPGKIRWNFDKFLLNRQGEVVARFHPKTKPDADEVTAKIEQLLATQKTPEGVSEG